VAEIKGHSEESVPIRDGVGRQHPMPVFGDHRSCAGSRVAGQKMPAPHMHSQVEINFVLLGAMTYWFDRRALRLEEGQLALFWGMMPHQVTEAPAGTKFACFYPPISLLLGLPNRCPLRDAILRGAFILAGQLQPPGKRSLSALAARVDEPRPTARPSFPRRDGRSGASH
jgi:AraC family transcriptional regulator, melibiose operon regulatory protein